MSDPLKPPSLEDMLSDSDPPEPEDLSSVTIQAIVSPKQNSLLALFNYVRRKHKALDKRLGKVETRIVFIMGGFAALMVALEVYRTFFAAHH